MSQALGVALTALATLAVLALIGAGPALALLRNPSAQVLVAAPLGLAILSATGVTAALLAPLGTLAIPLLLTLLAASAALGWRHRNRLPTGDALLGRRRGWAAALAAAGALGPMLMLLVSARSGSSGPVVLAVADVWQHVPRMEFLRENRIWEFVPVEESTSRLVSYQGDVATRDGYRFGMTAVAVVLAAVLPVGDAAAFWSLHLALLALLPPAVWLVARCAGAPRLAALLAASGASGSTFLTLVPDGALDTIAGLLLVLVTVPLWAAALTSPGKVRSSAAGVLAAGVAAVYPEYLPPLAAAMATALVCTAWAGRSRATAMRLLRSSVAVLATMLLIAPYALVRLLDYYPWLAETVSRPGGPPRFLTELNTLPWLLGFLHLYELRTVTPAQVLPLAVLALLVLAMASLAWRHRVSTAGIGTTAAVPLFALVVGVGSFHSDPETEYAMWKWLVLAAPFVYCCAAVGTAALVGRGPATQVVAGGLAGVVVLLLVAADLRFLALLSEKGAPYPGAAAEAVRRATDDRSGQEVLQLEGLGAVAYPLSDWSALVHAASQGDISRLSFDATDPSWAPQGTQLLRTHLPLASYDVAGEHDLVLTTTSGLATGRQRLSEVGHYAVEVAGERDAVLQRAQGRVVVHGKEVLPYVADGTTVTVRNRGAGPSGLMVRAHENTWAGAGLQLLSAGSETPLIPVLVDHGGAACFEIPPGALSTYEFRAANMPEGLDVQVPETDSDRVFGSASRIPPGHPLATLRAGAPGCGGLWPQGS